MNRPKVRNKCWLTVMVGYVLAAGRWVGIRHAAETLCCVTLLLMAINFLTVIFRKNITIDEATHIPAGYYHLVDGNFRFNNEHPPLRCSEFTLLDQLAVEE